MININPQLVIDLLNDLLVKDPEAIRSLIEYRVECNEKIQEHETVQVAVDPSTNKAKVGLLGILNGLVGINKESGLGYISVEYSDGGEGKLDFERFVLTPGTEEE